MEDWRNLSLSQLKRLAKGRAGRVAELQMEIRIIEGIMDSKIKSGDFKGSHHGEEHKPEPRREQPRQEKPKESEKPQITQPSQPSQSLPQQTMQSSQEPLIRPATQTPQFQNPQQNLQSTDPEQKPHPDFEKNGDKPKPSNPHAFKEIE